MREIEIKFYKRKKIEGKLEFLLKVGKLKTFPRQGWVLRKIKNPETIAEHIFFLALLVWFLGEKLNLNSEKILKMALVHEICEVYAKDQTPYEGILSDVIKDRRKILERWPRFLKKEKERRFLRDYKTEKSFRKNYPWSTIPSKKRNNQFMG